MLCECFIITDGPKQMTNFKGAENSDEL